MARSAFYPSLRLSGSAGWTNNGLAGIVNPGSLLLQAATSLAQPLLGQNKNRVNLDIAKVQQQQALITFERKVLDAGNEVNNAMAEYHSALRVCELQQNQIERLQTTLTVVKHQMEYGDINYLQVLLARQSLLEAQLAEVSAQYGIVNSYVTLFQILGGR